MGEKSPSPAGRMSRRGLVVFLVVLVPCLIAANQAGVWLAGRMADHGQIEPAPRDSPIIVVPASLDFGSPWETDAFAWDVVFENASDRPVTLSDVRGACDCTKTAWTKDAILKPGERLTVPLVIDLLQLGVYDLSEIRPVQVVLLATATPDEGEPSPTRWVLRGAVHRLLTCEPGRASLGEDLTCGEPGRPLEFRLTPHLAIDDVRLKGVPEGWSAELKKVWTQPPTYLLHATPCKARPGPFTDEFNLEARASDGRAMPTQPIKVAGRVTDGIEVLPRPLDLGTVPVGATSHASLWVRVRSGESLRGVTVVPADPDTKVAGVRQEAGAWRVDLERVIRGAGDGEGRGMIRTEPSGREASFVLHWYGTEK